MKPHVLVAGIGNIFLGDDGFGVEVVRRLAETPLDDRVVVEDFGIRGTHLALELSSGQYDGVILVDAVPRGSEPGTLYVMEPDVLEDPVTPADDGPTLTPATVLAWVKRLGGSPVHVVIVGCEPASVDEWPGLSEPVEAAVADAVKMVRDLAAVMTQTEPPVCA
jgi:hydrogenase maturation protease